MDNSYNKASDEVLDYFEVSEDNGLSNERVVELRQKYGRNGTSSRHTFVRAEDADLSTALPDDPPTPIWKLILEQFKDQLVVILLGSAAVSFVLALFEEGDDWTAFVDPAVVCTAPCYEYGLVLTSSSTRF